MSTDTSPRNIHHRRRGRIDNQKRFQIEIGLFHSETSSHEDGQHTDIMCRDAHTASPLVRRATTAPLHPPRPGWDQVAKLRGLRYSVAWRNLLDVVGNCRTNNIRDFRGSAICTTSVMGTDKLLTSARLAETMTMAQDFYPLTHLLRDNRYVAELRYTRLPLKGKPLPL